MTPPAEELIAETLAGEVRRARKARDRATAQWHDMSVRYGEHLRSMRRDDLRNYARALGITRVHDYPKDELVYLITAHTEVAT